VGYFFSPIVTIWLLANAVIGESSSCGRHTEVFAQNPHCFCVFAQLLRALAPAGIYNIASYRPDIFVAFSPEKWYGPLAGSALWKPKHTFRASSAVLSVFEAAPPKKEVLELHINVMKPTVQPLRVVRPDAVCEVGGSTPDLSYGDLGISPGGGHPEKLVH